MTDFVLRSRRHRSRGSVIVLVVAVLALLAVIGTVYILAARAERGTAGASAIGVNLDLARDAVNSLVRDTIGKSMYDANGVVGGYNAMSNGATPPLIVPIARRWDMPESGYIFPPFVAPPPPNGVEYAVYDAATGVNQSYPAQSWLCTNLYRWPLTNWVGSVNLLYPPFNDVSIVSPSTLDAGANIWRPACFDPATGAYDIPYFSTSVTPPNPFLPFFNVVANPLPPAATVPPITLPTGASFPITNPPEGDALIQLLPFSEASGIRYRFGVRIIDTSRMANLNVGLAAYPSPDINGTYFNSYPLSPPATLSVLPDLTAMYIDAPGNAQNIDVGFPPIFGRHGSLTENYIAWQSRLLRLELSSSITPFDLSDELELRSYGDLGTAYMARPAALWQNTLLNISGGNIVGNVRRSDYTAYSYSRELRPFLGNFLWNFSTSSPAYMANPNPTPPYTLSGIQPKINPNNPNVVWPPFPARISTNPDISNPNFVGTFSHEDADDALAIAATNIASAMEICGYTHDEACAFAANYLTYRWDGVRGQALGWAVNSNNSAYYLPNGPSFIDGQGICIRNADLPKAYGSGSATDLHALPVAGVTPVYLGYAAQPFINEVAETCHSTPLPTPSNTVADCAIELYNPYDKPLDLSDFQIRVINNAVAVDVPLSNQYIPAKGYFVIVQQPSNANTDLIGSISAGAQKVQNASLVLDTTTSVIYLMRRYVDRSGATQWGAVDKYDCTRLEQFISTIPPPGSDTYADFYIRRSNAVNTDGPWGAAISNPSLSEATVHNNTGATAPEIMTLGAENPPDDAATPQHVLYDRYLLGLSPPAQGSPLSNIADFNRIMRICNVIDPGSVPAGGNPLAVISTQVYACNIGGSDPPGVVNFANMKSQADARIHFDFRSPPWIYNHIYNQASMPTTPAPYTAYPGDPNPPPGGLKTGDIRAMYLLECLSFVDRVSDFTIDLGDNTSFFNAGGTTYYERGISKLRIPGQINVNTAPPEILAAILSNAKRPAGITTFPNYTPNQLAGAILAYRWRTTSTDLRIPAAYQSSGPLFDFSNLTQFPGYGIRSLGELNIPMSYDTSTGDKTPTVSTLDLRDTMWAQIYNYCTVRSDTFAVYAYLEAVKQNTRYIKPAAGTIFNNSTDWYINDFADTGGTGQKITDDFTDTTAKLLRVGRRRWVAIVDRSLSNSSRYLLTGAAAGQLDPTFAPPKIVAIKDLPQ